MRLAACKQISISDIARKAVADRNELLEAQVAATVGAICRPREPDLFLR